ncbi:hypothetical protein AMAG_03220 [Allomyces macrogynus ATCC 38327]|uniref:Protein EFR3 n=1 Tax=Allomyces macrogynus (strain ATCC 38327) TaxID=578462 RepID=A0A0L0S576_ALLM3|nr:hypothetical protein AMAG_03220 [Allomyces macrogynus ATCC 38327]|eukprot:KNE57514.1 hypothetical protein AMAG_03220 [Allomyces macrogynus ATCC 38327]
MSAMDDVKVYCFSGLVKHANLVNKVYPQRAGDEPVPQASHLAYLVFYAQHRPEKLAKVARYLGKRYRWDASKNRTGFHLVTLAILNALIDACPAHLPYFARDAITILLDVVDRAAGTSPDLLAVATVTFIKFNAHYDGSLDADPTFAPLFLALVDKYCQLAVVAPKPTSPAESASPTSSPTSPASRDSSGSNHVHEITLAGLEGLKAIAYSPYLFTSSKCERYTSKLIPALLANLRAKSTTGTSPTSSPRTRAAAADDRYARLTAHRRMSVYDDLLGDDELAEIALTALQRLVRAATASAIAHVILPVFAFLDANAKWNEAPFVTLVLRSTIAVSSIPTQTIILGQILNRLNIPTFAHKARLLSVLPQTRLAMPCLAISQADVVDCLVRNAAEQPVHVARALAWLTTEFATANALRDCLALITARIAAPSLLGSVLAVLETLAGIAPDSTPPPVDPPWLVMDQLDPLFPLLDGPDSGLAVRTAALLARAPPAPTTALALALAPHAANLADRDLAVTLLDRHAARCVPAALADLDTSAPAVATAWRAHMAADGRASPPPAPAAEVGSLGVGPAGASSETLQRLYKPRSMLQFQSLDRKPTTDEFRAILDGRPVLERPVSMGPDWALPSGELDLDDVLDKV